MKIEVNFDYWRELNPDRSIWESRGSADPDSKSKRLQKTHQLLWSKRLPNGAALDLELAERGQLVWREFRLSSDSITNSYIADSRLREIVAEEKALAEQLFLAGSRISAFILFPANRIERQNTINGARGMNAKIADRMDLTLECIRRHYSGDESPLSDVLNRYAEFFSLFVTFERYVDFWLLNDLVDEKYLLQFYRPFNDFRQSARPSSVEECVEIANSTLTFLKNRGRRINEHVLRNNSTRI